MVNNMRSPALRFYGGKWRIAEKIIAMMPPHDVYVEPFCGGASVFMRKPKARMEIINDRWDIITNYFTVLRCKKASAELYRLCELTPYSREEFRRCHLDAVQREVDPIEQARMFVFGLYACRAGQPSPIDNGKQFKTSFTSNATPSQSWKGWTKNIPAYTNRLRDAQIENMDACDLIAKVANNQDALIYVDPPYMPSTRKSPKGYKFEMTVDEHIALMEQLKMSKAMIMLSAYEHPLYDEVLGAGWQKQYILAQTASSSKRMEVVWMNKALVDKVRVYGGRWCDQKA